MHGTRNFVYFFGMTQTTVQAGAAQRRGAAAPDRELLHSAMALFDTLPDVPFFVKNTRSEFVHANPGFVAMLGAPSLAAILGKTDHEFSPQELAGHFIRDDRQVMRSGKAMTNRVELVLNADGGISWHMTTKVPIRDRAGKVIGLAGITRDLSRASVTVRRYGEMAPVMEYLEAHYAGPIVISELAARIHVSASQLERRFKALFQTTPAHYVIRFRLNKASQQLASTGAKITDIATRCGFYDHSHFVRQFTRAYGLSPTAYRRRHQ